MTDAGLQRCIILIDDWKVIYLVQPLTCENCFIFPLCMHGLCSISRDVMICIHAVITTIITKVVLAYMQQRHAHDGLNFFFSVKYITTCLVHLHVRVCHFVIAVKHLRYLRIRICDGHHQPNVIVGVGLIHDVCYFDCNKYYCMK